MRKMKRIRPFSLVPPANTDEYGRIRTINRLLQICKKKTCPFSERKNTVPTLQDTIQDDTQPASQGVTMKNTQQEGYNL